MKNNIKKALKKIVPLIAGPLLSKIRMFKDVHKGESCYLFGNGNSLKYFDFKKFDNKITIGCTYLPFHKEFEFLNCPYLVFTDSFQFFPINRLVGNPQKIFINKVGLEYRRTIGRYKDRKFFLDLSNYPVTWNYRNVIYEFQDILDSRLSSDFISKKFNCFEGSLRAQVLLAIYMGFDEAVLVGHDYTHCPARAMHFYEKGEGFNIDLLKFNDEFLNFAKRFINLKTITLNGRSETVEYTTYKNYFGSEPLFRENKEIVAENYLRVLSTRPGYFIY